MATIEVSKDELQKACKNYLAHIKTQIQREVDEAVDEVMSDYKSRGFIGRRFLYGRLKLDNRAAALDYVSNNNDSSCSVFGCPRKTLIEYGWSARKEKTEQFLELTEVSSGTVTLAGKDVWIMSWR